MRPRPPTGEQGWRKGGDAYISETGFLMKTDMMPAVTGTQDEKVTPFPY